MLKKRKMSKLLQITICFLGILMLMGFVNEPTYAASGNSSVRVPAVYNIKVFVDQTKFDQGQGSVDLSYSFSSNEDYFTLAVSNANNDTLTTLQTSKSKGTIRDLPIKEAGRYFLSVTARRTQNGKMYKSELASAEFQVTEITGETEANSDSAVNSSGKPLHKLTYKIIKLTGAKSNQRNVISEDKKSVTMENGETFTIKPTCKTGNVHYSSSNENLVTVSAKGKVTACKKTATPVKIVMTVNETKKHATTQKSISVTVNKKIMLADARRNEYLDSSKNGEPGDQLASSESNVKDEYNEKMEEVYIHQFRYSSEKYKIKKFKVANGTTKKKGKTVKKYKIVKKKYLNSYHWTKIIRCNDTNIALEAVSQIKMGCRNKHIGYDLKAKNASPRLAAIVTKKLKEKGKCSLGSIDTDCETRCSDFVIQAYRCAGVSITDTTWEKPNYIWSGNIVKKCRKLCDSNGNHVFKVLNYTKNTKLYPGDIVVTVKKHTGMVVN